MQSSQLYHRDKMSSRRKKMSRMKIGSVLRKVSKKRRRKKLPKSSELRPGNPRARRKALLGRIWT